MKKQEIINKFKEAKTEKEIKKVFRNLAKILHPDKGGTNEDFKTLSEVYFYFLNGFENHFENDYDEKDIIKTTEEMQNFINKIVFFDGVNIQLVGVWLWIDGNTKQYKTELKNLNCRWSHTRKKWYYRDEKDRMNKNIKSQNISFAEIIQKYGSQKVETKKIKQLSYK